jgi:ABC-2 type transport system ATP-binding protein
LHDPQILLLDEPTVGVDPQSRNAIFDNLEVLKKRGKTLIYTTHYMEEAERLCDRLIIVDHGKVVANDTLSGLYRLLPISNVLAIELDGRAEEPCLDQLKALPWVQTAELLAGILKVGLKDLSAGAPKILQWLDDGGHPYLHVVSERADLETVFLTLTGRSLRDS